MADSNDKYCPRCDATKPRAEFHKDSSARDGLRGWCKPCTRANINERDATNPEAKSSSNRRYYQRNRARRIAKQKRYYAANRVEILARRKLPAQQQRSNEQACARRRENPQARLAHSLRNRLNMALRTQAAEGSAVRSLGCSVAELMVWLEEKFVAGMTWENYGAAWHVDHVKPLAKFDLTQPEQLLQACHYTNLQPLSVSDNLHKGARFEEAVA